MKADDLRVLAEEQAAFRRVATLVARGTAPEEVFAAVIGEVGRLLPVDVVSMSHYQNEGTVTFVARWGKLAGLPLGNRRTLGGRNVGTLVFQTGRPARVDGYADSSSGPIGAAAREAGLYSSVGSPIIVDGRVWGVIAAGSSLALLPPDTEARLASFTELVATAIANAESRAALARLAEEQTALWRVATLVARGVPPEEVFAAVTEEVGKLLSADLAYLCRYEPDRMGTFVASWGRASKLFPVNSRWPLGGRNIATLVFKTGRPARVDSYADATGAVGAAVRETGLRSAAGAPIIAEGHLWGMISVGSSQEQPLSPDTEARLASFTELVATAVMNAENLAALAASRARIVAAADEARRRIERDLHDGIQQQLGALILDLRTVQASVPAEFGELASKLSPIAEHLAGVSDQVRTISQGVHPAILSRRGLEPALESLARQFVMPVELDLRAGRRLPEHVEVAAYYAVSEALTNAAKHAHASAVHVELGISGPILQLAIRDDGIGGADPALGSGLAGLSHRIEALGGTLEISSPGGAGTTLRIEIPAGDAISPPSPDPGPAGPR